MVQKIKFDDWIKKEVTPSYGRPIIGDMYIVLNWDTNTYGIEGEYYEDNSLYSIDEIYPIYKCWIAAKDKQIWKLLQ